MSLSVHELALYRLFLVKGVDVMVICLGRMTVYYVFSKAKITTKPEQIRNYPQLSESVRSVETIRSLILDN